MTDSREPLLDRGAPAPRAGRAGRRWLLPCLAACLLVTACGAADDIITPGTLGADQILFERGNAALEEGRWDDARQYFTTLIDGYPGSQYRADAKLAMGDVYLEQGTPDSLIFAQNEFREFLTFYPTGAKADYAQFKLGMTHFEAMRGPGRDQTETANAIREFQTFLRNYPDSPLRPDVEAKLREALDRRGDHEYGVGLTYYRMRAYRAAAGRFEKLLKDDPAYTGRDEVYFYLAEIFRRSENLVEALPYYDRLVTEFAESEHLDDARQRISELKQQLDAQGVVDLDAGAKASTP